MNICNNCLRGYSYYKLSPLLMVDNSIVELEMSLLTSFSYTQGYFSILHLLENVFASSFDFQFLNTQEKLALAFYLFISRETLPVWSQFWRIDFLFCFSMFFVFLLILSTYKTVLFQSLQTKLVFTQIDINFVNK